MAFKIQKHNTATTPWTTFNESFSFPSPTPTRTAIGTTLNLLLNAQLPYELGMFISFNTTPVSSSVSGRVPVSAGWNENTTLTSPPTANWTPVGIFNLTDTPGTGGNWNARTNRIRFPVKARYLRLRFALEGATGFGGTQVTTVYNMRAFFHAGP